MSKITVAFIKAAIIYFVLAMLLGIHMSRTGVAYPSMPVHVHFNLLGWMSMMIYGVAYHILPRFSGRPLWSEKLSKWHFYLANIGLIGMTLGWFLIGPSGGGGTILYISSLIEGVSIIFFALNMFKTVKAAPPTPPRPPVRPKPPTPPVKTSAPPAAATPEAEAKVTKKTPSGAVTKAEKSPAKAKKKARPTAKKVKKEAAPKEADEKPAPDKKEAPREDDTRSGPVEAEASKKTEAEAEPEPGDK